MGWHGFKNQLDCYGLSDWPVIKGTGQYTLTVEQLAQKAFKRAMSREGKVTKFYSGWWLPLIDFGFIIGCFKIPKTDENRLQLKLGESMLVTRTWGKYWWYGEKISELNEELKRSEKRGWFPAKCVILDPIDEDDPYEKETHCESVIEEEKKDK